MPTSLGLDLASATLDSANLTGANLTGADLADAQLDSSNLSGAQLQGADLAGVEAGQVSGTPTSLPANWSLLGGYLLGPKVNLINANLNGYDLSGLDLAGAYMWYANLVSANLDRADLAGADFNSGTNLTGATFTGADLSHVTWVDTICPDGINSDKYIDGCFSRLDTAPPVVTVTGVKAGHVYGAGSVPAAGCRTTDKYSQVTVEATVEVTSRERHGLGAFTATCSGAQDLAGNAARPVSATYNVAYGFAGFRQPSPGATLARSRHVVNVVFRLHGATGRTISRATGAALARARDVIATLRGPRIAPVTAVCRWQSAGSYFRCALRIPHRVRTGRSARYMITAYEKVPYAGVVAAPGTPGAANPEIVHFR